VPWLLAFILLWFEAVLVIALGYGIAIRGSPPPSLNLRQEAPSVVDVDCGTQNGEPAPQVGPFSCNDRLQRPYVQQLQTQVQFWQGVRPSPEPLARIDRNSKPSSVSVATEDLNGKLPDIIDEINKIVLMSLGVFVIARGRGRLPLLAGVALYGIAAGLGIRAALIDLPAPLVIVIHLTRQVLLAAGLLCLTVMSVEMLRSASRSGVRPVIIKTLLIVAVLMAAIVLGASVYRTIVYPLLHTLYVEPNGHAPAQDQTWRLLVFLPPALAMLLPIGIMFAATARAAPSHIGFYRWIFASTALGLSGTIIWLLCSTFVSSRQVLPLVLTEIIMGVGYAYAIVRHRLVDIAFVINRAVVLAVFGVIVAATAVLAEVLIDPTISSLFGSQSGGDSFNPSTWNVGLKALGFVLILTVGLTLRFMEPPIDWLIDRLLFARRYRIKEGLATLRGDSREAITPEGIIDLVTSQLRGLIGARSIALYEQQGEAYVPTHVTADAPDATPAFGPLKENDQAILRIRSSLAPCEAHGLSTDLPPSAVAFPMAPGDHFMGAVVAERHSSTDPYDPDLRALIGKFVQEFAAALLFLRSSSARD
jgi:hypothetical protein